MCLIKTSLTSFCIREIAELSEKKNFIVSVSKVGNKDNYNVKFKSDHPLFSQAPMTVNVDMAGDYPFRPPSVRFAHQFYHPNVDRGGDICIPIVCFDNWKPATTLENSEYSDFM
ncbi:ubiquitin--protein ligase [Ancylostoma duodenale]|uniref:Ubiquitin--protein ligase n=1 Tax=Ancylostoma duodenale TaxID=51022 RepID=A0A0C2CW95_9BILA|nr:ubiquitin--protein ligase [Ancylostoma duodenale]